MQIIKFALTASILAVLSAPAVAAEGWYVGAQGGANKTHHDNLTDGATGADADYNWGWLAGANVGYNFGNGWRNEVEATYRQNNIDDIGGIPAEDKVKSWAFMYNGIYDFDLGMYGFKPYLGAGLGLVRSKLETTGVDDWNSSLGYQGIAGANYELDNNWALYADYRYLSTFDRTSYNSSVGTGAAKTDYANSSIVLGLRYTFAAPAPVPAAAPAAVVAPAVVQEEGSVSRKYLVFFDFNKASLTPEAVDVLKQAANDASAGQAVALEVSGHTDTSGSDSYNQKLSSKRAAAVKAELAKLGITGSAISTVAKGESDPLVPTGDGVKEPQNRRAEITYVIKAQR